jgi:hypothetical protein
MRALLLLTLVTGCIGPPPCDPDECCLACHDLGSPLGVCLDDACECVDPEGGTFRPE